MIQSLPPDQRSQALAELSGWLPCPTRDAIEKTFTFKDFSQAFAFMTRVALAAEKQDHHPQWSNTYNHVSITLSTHDCNGLSHKDITLAHTIDTILS